MCASRREQDSNKIVQLMQALARDSFLVSLAAVLIELLTAAVVENGREKAGLDWGFVFTSILL